MATQHEGLQIVTASSAEALRGWLKEHHQQKSSVWLRLFKKASSTPSVTYDEAVDELLCYGWIDSRVAKWDSESYLCVISPRRPRSNWSAINKRRVQKLIAQGKMTPAGQGAIDCAKDNGQWDALNGADSLTLPDDLAAAMQENPKAQEAWDKFPKSYKRGTLEWVLSAKRAATRERRIEEVVRLSGEGKRRGAAKAAPY